MDYWKVNGVGYVIILFEHYMESKNDRDEIGEHFVKSSDVKELIHDLNETEYEYIFLNMQHVKKVASRAFSCLKDEKILKNIVFYCVKENGEVSNTLKADLNGLIKEINGMQVVLFSDEAENKFRKTDIKEICRKQRVNILKKYVNKEIGFLTSSGIYSNMSLDYKKIFEYPREFRYIISELYCLICSIEEKQRIDFLVAASKNSITLTAILSKKLNKEAIYHTNIGQKYVKQKSSDKVENQVDIIQRKKRYLMIYDVICLGTELRILNGIINAFGGNLVGAVGLVCVQAPEVVRGLDSDSILSKAKCLVTTKEMELDYRIALTEEELKNGNEN